MVATVSIGRKLLVPTFVLLTSPLLLTTCAFHIPILSSSSQYRRMSSELYCKKDSNKIDEEEIGRAHV